MNRYLVFGLAVVLAFLAGITLTLIAMPFVQSQMFVANNSTNSEYGRGMMGGIRRGMMGGNYPDANAQPNQAPPVTPTPTNVAPQATQSTSALPANAKTGKAGNLNVVLVMTPQPAAFSTTTFDITLTDEKGTAVSDASVSLDLAMPSMYMPPNKPQAQPLGNGKYQASGRFTMRGGWRINIIIERGGQKQNVYFDIGL
jgi:hypothetical protein